MDKDRREELEYKSLYTDERYAKKAIKQLLNTSLQSDAAVLPDFIDAHGNTTPQSEIYRTAYSNIQARLEAEGKSRKPQKAEILIEAAVIRAAFDNSALNLVLERTAGKVKEEISIGVGQYEELSDDELTLLAEHRRKQITTTDGDD